MKNFIILIFSICAFSVTGQKLLDVSFEFQAYPTGLIPGIHVESEVGSKSTLSLRLGYNWFRHRDLGVHDDERGDGFGLTLGYKRYFKEGFKDWYLAAKLDYWSNEVDWYDEDGLIDRVSGTTEITVLQPTVELGYTIVKNDSFIITPTLAFGAEWNVRTEGEPTGEGLIVLIGIQIGKRFNVKGQ